MTRNEAHDRAIAAVNAAGGPTEGKPDMDEDGVIAFHQFIINEYTPPADKRFLIFFQCCVGRPFYRTGSHGSMRKAVAIATGHDPWKDFDRCPAHVVVLASRVGPAPYELQDMWPINVSSGGVKHFSHDYYWEMRPVLAGRMAEYITTHGPHYEHLATFTQGRYADVMYEAARIAGVEFPIFPDEGGERIIRHANGKAPRTYWQKFWVQLCREIIGWLTPAEQQAAAARRAKLDLKTETPRPWQPLSRERP